MREWPADFGRLRPLYAGKPVDTNVLLPNLATPTTLVESSDNVLPEGLTCRLVTNRLLKIEGVVEEPGEYLLSVQVREGRGEVGLVRGTLKILAFEPSLADCELLDAVVGAEYFEILRAEVVGLDTPELTVDRDALPEGLIAQPSFDHILFLGSAEEPGEFNVEVCITKGNEREVVLQRSYSLFVHPAEDFVIQTRALPDMNVSDEIRVPLQAAGGKGSAADVSWSVAAGKLPPGLELRPDDEGRSLREYKMELAGTPERAGYYRFTLSYGEIGGRRDERSFAVTVRDTVSFFGVPIDGDVGFIIDRSSKLAADKLDVVKSQLIRVINDLPDGARINIAAPTNESGGFEMRCWRDSLTPLDDTIRASALEYVGKLQPGTQLDTYASSVLDVFDTELEHLFYVNSYAPLNWPAEATNFHLGLKYGRPGYSRLTCVSIPVSWSYYLDQKMRWLARVTDGDWIAGG